MFARKILLGLCLAFLSGTPALADTVALAPDHPTRHTVVKGDTLWDISARFLRDPWRWPDVWHINPEIKNPHLIYPGDVIVLRMVDGQPVLEVERVAAATEEPSRLPVVKLSPQVRVSDLNGAIPTIAMDVIQPFLLRARVIGAEEFDRAPYIVASEGGRLATGAGNKIYARNMADIATSRVSIFHQGRAYRNPGAKKDDILGYEAIHVADASIERMGDPATVRITDSYRETLVGDRLFPFAGEDFSRNFFPRSPDKAVSGNIIDVVDGVSKIGRYQVVVLNLGGKNGIGPGHVLAIHQAGNKVRDIVRPGSDGLVTLPEERAGLLMVFRAFERVSYALVMKSERDIRVYDMVRNP
ncbi:MAG: LysM peptidoglycan-binding domain-containing protein [Gammaproteobacteria bacterium]|nr:LysM peptidoglycan-binding domain-containing protein [Gammaproteobacteria bacterium]